MASSRNDERSLEPRGWDTVDDDATTEQRPVTAQSSASLAAIRPTKLPSRSGKKPAPELPSEVATIDGWGDFDTDRLLRDGDHDYDGSSVHGSESVDAAALRRDQRLEALAKHTGKAPTPAPKEPARLVLRQRTLAVMELAPPEGLPPDTSLSPVRHARKKPLVPHRRRLPDTEHAKLPKLKRGLAAGETARAVTGLFGPHIDDSLETRELIFQRFLPVWSLMPSRHGPSPELQPALVSDPLGPSHGSPVPDRATTRRSTAASVTVARDYKSSFECSMVLTKICKAIGIALSASPPPDVWAPSRRRHSSSTTTARLPTSLGLGAVAAAGDVDVDSFCEFVVRNALQPALHHFRLDRDVGEYLHTIDTVVHSLVTRSEASAGEAATATGQWRLRELSELQAVLPLWKKGIHFVQKQAPLVKAPAAPATATATATPAVVPLPDAEANLDTSENGHAIDDDASLQAIRARGSDVALIQTPDVSASYAKKLPAHEARAMQDANLRRKLQLRQSWQPRVVGGTSDLVAVPQYANANHPILGTSLEKVADSHGSPLRSCMRVEGLPPRPLSFDPHDSSAFQTTDNQVDTDLETSSPADASTALPSVPSSLLGLLLCGACPGDQEATLWCSACFAVFCAACWTTTHHSTVDVSAVTNQHELPAPTARPLRSQREDGSASLLPPVAMVYLPTKPHTTTHATLRRGSSRAVPPRPDGTNGTNQQPNDNSNESDGSDDERHERGGGHGTKLAHVMTARAMLPAIKPLREKPTVGRLSKATSAPVLNAGTTDTPLSSAMDSTANLLKALMLGTASSASVLRSSASGSPWSDGTSSSSAFSTSTTKPTNGPSSVVARMKNDRTSRPKLQPAAVTLEPAVLFPH